ncbi:hypothetical protein SSBR45G_41910 [Bradyrhizobium sp. SSBR45G]|uniref:hypothetical protein n=1 Tax=unclassified Bradyrhizobium TaxID=2631580 RepID=UPI0023428F18|nr:MULTISPECIES: hypothetical protein [unclassified Bradyrhizobium]GLH79282.1 hypothetical protein SSBR45G_41910 [Bradyrhizobium sp. SSBR45G]GLH86782.1 hypothetical protein SSBR45R_42420 [Bradyrhizobium sp. SSBR45R]
MGRQHSPESVPFTVVSRWLAGLATSLLARSLNMPEPLLHVTGRLVFAQVTAIETRAARSLCPARLRRQLLAWFR